MTCRDYVRPIIAKVIATVGRDDPKALRESLLAAYPFGERKYHPYRIWLSEIRYQLGKDKRRPRTPAPPDPNQKELF